MSEILTYDQCRKIQSRIEAAKAWSAKGINIECFNRSEWLELERYARYYADKIGWTGMELIGKWRFDDIAVRERNIFLPPADQVLIGGDFEGFQLFMESLE